MATSLEISKKEVQIDHLAERAKKEKKKEITDGKIYSPFGNFCRAG